MNTNRTWTCPYCEAIAKGDNRFKTHLKGAGGHSLPEDDVDLVMRKVLLGLKVPSLEDLAAAREEAEDAEE
jgi:hypothetical protein